MVRLGHGAGDASPASQAAQRQGGVLGDYTLINMGTPEQAANQIKSLAISRMTNHDYKSAYSMLLQAKNLYPALQNLEPMLFVSNLLHNVDTTKPGFGVNWLPMLHLPPSAHTSTIRNQFKDFIECLDAIKGEFPETSRAQEILRTAMQDFGNQGKLQQTIFQPVILGLERVNDGTNSGSAGTLKRKMPVEDVSNRRVTRNSSAKSMGDHCKSPKKELCDVVIMSEQESIDTQKIMKSDSQVSESAVSKIAFEEVHDGGSHCESNNGDGENQIARDDMQEVGGTPRSLVRKTGASSALTEEHLVSPEIKVLFDAMPQSPHYRALSPFGEQFRRRMITGIEQGFMVVAEQIRTLTNAEVLKCNEDSINNELTYLETMGYDVSRFRTRLGKLSRLAEQRQDLIEADQGELEDWKARREAFEDKLLVLHHSIVRLKKEMQRTEEKAALYQSAIDAQKAKEVEIRLQIDESRKEAALLDFEIERISKLPW